MRPPGKTLTRVAITSDWHWNAPPDVPECDLLLLPGDIFPSSGSGFAALAEWLHRQPARSIVAVAGNHDHIATTDEGRKAAVGMPWIYLENEWVEAEGLRIFGSPLSTPFNNWDFMADESKLEQVWATIPDDIDVLVTHGPARGLGDKTTGGVSTGSITLRERLRELRQLRLYAWGHIHEAHGLYGIPRANLEDEYESVDYTVGVNSSYVDERYQPVNPVVVIDL